MSDLLVNGIMEDVSALLSLYPDYETVERSFHAYAIRHSSTLWLSGCKETLAENMRGVNPSLGYESAIEFAQKIQATTDISLGLEILRNALNHEDE